MNSRVSWSVDGIDPSVRERAEAAARRAGMSLSDWLNSTIGESAPPNFRGAYEEAPAMPSQDRSDVADIHQRLDSITRQIDAISRPAPRNDAPAAEAPRAEPTVARQLNDAISRLDARLSQISSHAPRQPTVQERQRQTEMVERAAAQVYRPSPPLSPVSFDSAIAEIAARQSELDGVPPRQTPPPGRLPPVAPPMAPSAPIMASYAPQMQQPASAPAPAPMPAGPDFSSLERHLLKITSQIEALQRPDNVEQSIAAFRTELAEIRRAITEAMPRQAIDSIENEIRSLSRRIDETRQNGTDPQVLANLERALGEIYDALRALKPAEQLTGYDDAINNLGTKLDLILRSNDDPATVRRLEDAISAMREITVNVASNDALARVSEDLHALSAKVDQLSRAGNNNDSLASIEQRIAALTSSIETRERPVASDNSEFLEGALRSLSERLDRIPAGNDNASAFAHLEQRVTYLLERLETSGAPGASGGGNLGRVEEGLQDILRHLEHQHANLVRLADNTSSYAAPQPVMDSGIVDIVKRELSDIRFSQSETDRRTQDSLETVHSTLGHVVDRLAMIEGDLRAVRAAPPVTAPAPAIFETREEASRAAMPPSNFAPPAYVPEAQPAPQVFAPQPKPELPNPAAAQQHFAAAPREFHAAEPVAPPAVPPMTPRAISEILEPHAAAPRTAIAPELPPDHPLEPGTRPAGRPSSPSERIAASESVINEISAAAKEPVSSSSFIAAARRAAQAAAAAPANEKAAKAAAKANSKTAGKVTAIDKGKAADSKEPSNITSKIRSLLVGASVVAIVVTTFQMAMTLLDTGSPPPIPQIESTEPAPPALAPIENGAKPAPSVPAAPSMISPAPIGKQSNNGSAPNTLDSAQVAIPPVPQIMPVGIPQSVIPIPPQAVMPISPQAMMPVSPQAMTSPINPSDITGAIPATSGKLGSVQVPPTEKLPDGIGGPALRAAAMKGDPTAAYEVGVRFAEGKGVAANLDEAAKWYDRSAQAGVVPAIFRLGTFYEKGMSVKKDVEIARRYYLQAAERGNAKAMHNLAVLDADGGGKGANYKSASQWFRKAADRGVADSQFNLGILYARGIGVEQNLAESFKWFSLAAAQGDADSSRKRDDIAKRLDAQSLAAAKLAIQTFTPEPQPDAAINVAAPAGGWDSAPAQASPAKPPAKQASTKRAAAAMPLASPR